MSACVAAILTVAVRLALVLSVGGRFPPAADGSYYHVIATRIAEGNGYTWLWPDGAVTYAAHYPVGYPALVAIGYALLGPHPWAAMLENSMFGGLTAWSVHHLLRPHAKSERWTFAAALAVGLHPALLPYTPALMTEGVAAALLCAAAALAVRNPKHLWAAGLVMGVATLVRPQVVVLSPVLGAIAVTGTWSRLRAAAIITALSLAVCLPWTVRNCVRMNRCALVSVNAGWNLLIGAETESGAWQEVHVPEECTTVWDEAGKDVCFERAAKRRIVSAPASWLLRIPAKLRTTFDYFGAAPWYLHLSNPGAFSERAKTILGAVETVVCRLLLIAAHVMLGRGARWRWAVAAAGIALSFTNVGFLSYFALAGLAACTPGLLFGWTAAVIVSTAVTHAVFFGAGRYGLVVVPFVTAVAFSSRRGSASPPVA